MRVLWCSVKLHWCVSKLNSSREVVCLGRERKPLWVYICAFCALALAKCTTHTHTHKSRRTHKLCIYVNASMHKRQFRCVTSEWFDFEIFLCHFDISVSYFRIFDARDLHLHQILLYRSILLPCLLTWWLLCFDVWLRWNKLHDSMPIICCFFHVMVAGCYVSNANIRSRAGNCRIEIIKVISFCRAFDAH